ncbi:MAG: isocitrate/isopropylmalate family dehydrogenase, partial [Candidatus Thorarchaeota archaeon]
NEFGDIITDLGGAVQGGLGVAPAGSIGDNHAVFEPVHGSAPKHYGQKKANPIAAILASSMMLDWLGFKFNDKDCSDASDVITTGVANILREGKVRTYDLCRGEWESIKPSSTDQVGDEIRQSIKSVGSER